MVDTSSSVAQELYQKIVNDVRGAPRYPSGRVQVMARLLDNDDTLSPELRAILMVLIDAHSSGG